LSEYSTFLSVSIAEERFFTYSDLLLSIAVAQWSKIDARSSEAAGPWSAAWGVGTSTEQPSITPSNPQTTKCRSGRKWDGVMV
jgi:hypothetical protein